MPIRNNNKNRNRNNNNGNKTRRLSRAAMFRPRPPCPLLSKGVTEVDYKDLSMLRHYLGDEWKIQPGRINNISARMQRRIKTAIKYARYLSLLPYTEHHHVRKEQ